MEKKNVHIALCLIFLLGYATVEVMATDVSGIITSNTTWTLVGSPYIVVGNILINSGVTLTIEPGVTIKFNDYYLYIDGTFIARGNSSQWITFTSNQLIPQQEDWKEIKFRDASMDATFNSEGNYVSGCIMEYCRVEYAGGGGDERSPIHLFQSSAFLNHLTITNNNRQGIFAESSNSKINDCTISNVLCGIRVSSDSQLMITNCHFTNNGEGIMGTGSHSDISDCIFTNNTYGIGLSGNGDITNCTITNNNYGMICALSDATINNCNISYNSNDGLRFDTPTWPKFTNCRIMNNGSYGINCSGGAYPEFNNCTISDNGNSGIYVSGAPNVFDCIITGNNGNGIELHSSTGNYFGNRIINNTRNGFYISGGCNPKIERCNMSLNAEYDMYNASSNNISCPNNYWGTTNTSIINENIYDFYDEFDFGKVLYNPISDEDNSLPVEIVSFTAGVREGEIILHWVTESETNNIGFHVYRSLDENNYYERITTTLIEGADNSSSRHEYTFIDWNVVSGNTYFYKLEDVDVYGNSVFHGPISVMVEQTAQSQKTCAFQNYPNPFNLETEIAFVLGKEGLVRLEIFNSQGQIVALLKNEEMPAGEQKVKFDASGLASGIYYYRITAGDYFSINKMTLIR